jgi:predicted nucleic acid-binding protein
VPDATDAEILPWLTVIRPKDAPVLAAAIKAKPQRLVTLDNRDFLRSADIAQKTGIKICPPGDLMQKIRTIITHGFQHFDPE